jgi:hypothetical protein
MNPNDLLHSHLARVLGSSLALALLGACNREESTACITIDDEAECPSVDEAAETLVGSTLCTDPVEHVVDVVAFSDRSDFDSWMDTGSENPAHDQCCYDVIVRLEEGAWCGGGRALLVGQDAVAAPVTAGPSDWSAAPVPSEASLAQLDPALRALLAAHWARQAQAEHASVAAFAQLALDLLAFAAPAELVERAHQAAADEVRHAKRAFALAGAYAGSALRPGPLRVPPRHLHDLAALAAATAREGCLGETMATLVAAEALTVAREPAVRAALALVVADEARHAAHAWAIVSWAIATGGPDVADAVAAVLSDPASSITAFCAALPEVPLAGLAAHGLLDRATVRRALEQGVVRVLGPATVALLGPSDT